MPEHKIRLNTQTAYRKNYLAKTNRKFLKQISHKLQKFFSQSLCKQKLSTDHRYLISYLYTSQTYKESTAEAQRCQQIKKWRTKFFFRNSNNKINIVCGTKIKSSAKICYYCWFKWLKIEISLYTSCKSWSSIIFTMFFYFK